MFADVVLARRIEAAESGLTREVAEAVRAHGTREVLLRALGGLGVGVWIGGSPFDKVIGWGFGDAEAEDAALRGFEDAVRSREGAVQLELSTLADLSRADALIARGYTLVGAENVLGMRLDRASLAPPAIEVRRARDDEGDAWIDTVVNGFEHPDGAHVAAHEAFPRDALVQVFHDIAGAQGYRRYLAMREGAIAGGASLRVHRDENGAIAQLAGAATLPAHRRRGVQSALLRARLRDAAEAGCDLAVVTTQPGSRSQHNAQNAGFALLYTRLVLVRGA
ncbi:GNAT family N-acetyltransferase [Sandaracinus amylolyticus]|nr:GNAT family N-acetyltransferase [Sandaracinus amylolyticus]